MRARIDRMKSAYLSLWHGLKGWKLFLFYIVHYTILFLILQRFVFAAFSETGKGLVWTTDGTAQHYTRLVYLREIWRDNIRSLLSGQGWSLPMYDFHSGPALADPQMGLPQLFVVLWPDANIDSFYDLYTLSNFYWIGLSFSVFGFYWKQKPLPVLIGSVSYVFCTFALHAGVRHPHFMLPMILLPILILGAEEVLKGRNAWIFMLSVFLSLTTQWGVYFSCMQIVFVMLYLVVRFFDVYSSDRIRQALRLIGRLAVWGGIPVLLAAASWLPTLIHIIGADRVGNGATLPDDMLRYKKNYYIWFFEHFIVIPDGAGQWNHLGFSVLTLPALLLFIRRKKNERSLKILFVVLTVMLCIPAVAYVMSGFSNISNRFCFGYAFCMAVILMFMLPHMVSLTRREVGMLGLGMVAYCAVCYFGIERSYFDARPTLMLLAAVLVFGFCYLAGFRKESLLFAALLVTCFSVRYTAFWKYDPSEGNYVSEFYASGEEMIEAGQYASLSASAVIAEDDDFFRVTGSSITAHESNYAFHYELNGLSMYPYYGWSNAYIQWVNEMEAPRYHNKHRLDAHTTNAPMLALTSVKYYAYRDTATMPQPFGFTDADEVQNGSRTDTVLENENWLPIGYTYDQYMTRQTYEALNALGKQEALLSAMLLEEEPTLDGLSETIPQPTAQQIPYTISKTDGLTWSDGQLKVTKANAVMTLSFEGLPQTDTYLRIAGLDLTNGNASTYWYLTATSGDITLKPLFYADGHVYSHRQYSQTLDFGFHEESLTEMTITFPNKGTCKLEDLQIWCQPMDQFAEQVTALKAESLQNVTTDWHSLRGDITVSGDKLLCLAIPYADGWTAYVDGEETKLYQANTAFMAVGLSAGSHTVEIRYWMPGLTTGLFMSGAGLIGLVVLIILSQRKKKALIA